MYQITHPLTLESPPSGEHFTFHTSARQSDGRFRFTYRLAPGKAGPGAHKHRRETHFMRVRSGRGTAWLDGVRHDLGPGDELVIPPGVAHRFRSFGPAPLVVACENDGPSFEDFAIPLAVAAQQSGGRIDARLVATVFVQTAHCAPSIPTGSGRVAAALFGAVARVLGLFVRPLPPVPGWDDRADAAA